MKKKNLGKKLYDRRKLLGHSQYYVATKLGMTQPALSLLEKNKIKFTDELVQKVKSIEEYEDFDTDTPEKVSPVESLSFVIKEPWVMYSLILVGLVAFILYADFLFGRAEDAARGYGAASGSEFASMVYIFASIFIAITIIFLFAGYRILKWWWKRRSKRNSS